MALKSIKDVVNMLGEFKTKKEELLKILPELRMFAILLNESGQTPDEYINEIKTEIVTLDKSISILEKESDNG